MKRHFIILAAISTLMIPAICAATPPRPGLYASGFIGLSAQKNTGAAGLDYNFETNTLLSFDDHVEFDPGINIGGTVGYDYGIIRLEGELSYKHGEITRISDQSGKPYRYTDGYIGASAFMFNAFFDLHNTSPVTPYLGGGIGFADMYLSDTFGTLDNSQILLYQGDNDSVFAYQIGAGLEIDLSPRLSLDLGYRYFTTTKARFGSNLDITTDLKFQSHNTAIGLRVKF